MKFEPTQEQTMYRDTVANFLKDRYSVENRRRFLEESRGYDAKNWADLAELGVLSLPISESLGGLDGNAQEVAIIQEELGYRLAVEPFAEGIALPAIALEEFDDTQLAQNLAGEIQAGTKTLGLALSESPTHFDVDAIETTAETDGKTVTVSGCKRLVPFPSADRYLASVMLTGDGLESQMAWVLVPADEKGVTVNRYKLVDGSSAADITFEQVKLPHEAIVVSNDKAERGIQRIYRLGTLTAVAESVGILRRMLELTNEYTNSRMQFGRKLAGNQVVRHRLVDMAMHLELARSSVMGAVMFFNGSDQTERYLSAAKVTVSKAVEFIAKQSIQLHGAIGVTDEYEISHYYKRALVLRPMYGSKRQHALNLAKLSSADE